MVNGHPRARFAHRRIHEVPHTGGVSSFRESVRLPDIEAHALSVLRRIGWNGVAMLEYRRDARTGDFRLLELNARFWGSLHLALAAGVDFPAAAPRRLARRPRARAELEAGRPLPADRARRS